MTERALLEHLAAMRRERGEMHTATARGLHDLALYYESESRDAEAEKYAADALALWVALDGHANGHVYRMLRTLARLYRRQGREPELSAMLDAHLPQIESAHPRGYYEESLESLSAILNGTAAAERIRALIR